MPTTDATLALELLTALDGLGVRYAVLHGEERLETQLPTSDVDVIVDRPGSEVVRLLGRHYSGRLVLVLVWESETATVNTFWCTKDGTGGVQLDLLHDPAGKSMLAFRTAPFLDRRQRGNSAWRITTEDENAYLASKRWLKGNRQAIAELRTVLPSTSSSAYSALTSRGQSRIESIRRNLLPSKAGFKVGVLRSRLSPRGLRRIWRPCGFSVFVVGSSEEIKAAFKGTLVDVVEVEGAGWRSRIEVGLLIRRPVLVVRRFSIHGDIAVSQPSQVVQLMHTRLRDSGWLG